MQKFALSVLICGSLLVSAGCTANQNAVFRNAKIPKEPSALVIDAKQRAVLSAYALLDANGQPDSKIVRRFCSEPSPDVFSVVAQALSAGGSFGKTADPASLELALNAAFSSAEQGATIPRTQTINMLREMMFRTCERYLSGGYDETELSIQAARDQRIMVSILAIEQLTGAVTPRPILIDASSSGSAGASGDAIVRLDDARKEKESAEAKHSTALKNFAEENGKDSVCDAIEGKKEDDLTDDQKAKVTPCNEKRKALVEAKAQLAAKTSSYQELSTLARSGGVTVTTNTSGKAEGGLDQAQAKAINDVALVVQDIVQRNFNDGTETLLFCQRQIRLLTEANPITESKQKVLDQCVDFAITYVDQKSRQLELETRVLENKLGIPLTMTHNDEGKPALVESATTNAQFDIFWLREQEAFSADATRTELINWIGGQLSRGEAGLKSCFATADNVLEMKACFMKLNNATRRQLAIGR